MTAPAMLSDEATKAVFKMRSANNIANRSSTSTTAVRARISVTMALLALTNTTSTAIPYGVTIVGNARSPLFGSWHVFIRAIFATPANFNDVRGVTRALRSWGEFSRGESASSRC